jgi:hypothetical protein
MILPEFVEISFKMPFYDIYFEDHSWDEDKYEKEPTELMELCDALAIEIDTNFLYEEYSKNIYAGGDIYVFYTVKNNNTFIYFDLIREPTDQSGMVFIGIKFLFADFVKIKEKVLALYFKAKIHTDLTEDYFQNKLHQFLNENNSRKIHKFNN